MPNRAVATGGIEGRLGEESVVRCGIIILI
jgi:hypothetical protein